MATEIPDDILTAIANKVQVAASAGSIELKCQNTCCPTATILPDQVYLNDDYGGAVRMTVAQFARLSLQFLQVTADDVPPVKKVLVDVLGNQTIG